MMPEITRNPLMTFLDEEFISYAGMEIMSKTIIAFVAIMCALRFFDMLTDSTTRPSRSHMLTRAIAAFTVPFIIVFVSTYASTMPASYRTYDAGTYEAGKTLPAGAYFLYSNGEGASVTIEGEKGKTSHQWTSGNLGATIYEGDKITFTGCVARNKTMGLTYSPGAATKHIALGTMCLVGGVDLQPGTYELKALDGDAGYEVREGYLESGAPINSEKFDDVAYADVHFGDVLYLSGASATLYSNAFSLSRPNSEEESLEGDKGESDSKEGEEGEEGKANGKEGEKGKNDDPANPKKSDGKHDETQDRKTGTDGKSPDAASDEKVSNAGDVDAGKQAEASTGTPMPGEATKGNEHAPSVTDAKGASPAAEIAGLPADKADALAPHDSDAGTDVNGDGKVDATDFIQRISVLPFPPAYDPSLSLIPPALSHGTNGGETGTKAPTTSPTEPTSKTATKVDSDDKKTGKSTEWSFGDALRDIAKESKRAVA